MEACVQEWSCHSPVIRSLERGNFAEQCEVFINKDEHFSPLLSPIYAGAESRHHKGAQRSLAGLPAVLLLLEHALLVCVVGTVHLRLLPGHQLRSGPVGDGAAFSQHRDLQWCCGGSLNTAR